MAKRASAWAQARRRGTPTFVGEFFETVGGRLVHGRKIKDDDTSADLQVARARAIVEVKGCGCNPARLRRSQFQAHKAYLNDEGCVFFDIMPYLIFFYRARRRNRWGQQSSIFKGCRDRDDHWNALALHTTDALLLDHAIIDSLPVQSLDQFFPDGGNGEDGSRLRKSDVPKLFAAHKEDLGLTLQIHTVHMRINFGLFSHVMRFRLSAVLTEQTRAQMAVVIPQLQPKPVSTSIRRRMSLV